MLTIGNSVIPTVPLSAPQPPGNTSDAVNPDMNQVQEIESAKNATVETSGGNSASFERNDTGPKAKIERAEARDKEASTAADTVRSAIESLPEADPEAENIKVVKPSEQTEAAVRILSEVDDTPTAAESMGAGEKKPTPVLPDVDAKLPDIIQHFRDTVIQPSEQALPNSDTDALAASEKANETPDPQPAPVTQLTDVETGALGKIYEAAKPSDKDIQTVVKYA